jgi:hypothetical protein
MLLLADHADPVVSWSIQSEQYSPTADQSHGPRRRVLAFRELLATLAARAR